jgi:hypothetical protein
VAGINLAALEICARLNRLWGKAMNELRIESSRSPDLRAEGSIISLTPNIPLIVVDTISFKKLSILLLK